MRMAGNRTWFNGFEQHKLAFLYDDEKDGRFSKLISREGADREDVHHRR